MEMEPIEKDIDLNYAGIIYERSYPLALEMAIDILKDILESGKRVSTFQINEFKKEDGRCYYEINWI